MQSRPRSSRVARSDPGSVGLSSRSSRALSNDSLEVGRGENRWPALSDGRMGEGVVGRFPIVLVDVGSCWSNSYDLGGFPMVFARFRPVRGTGERANGRSNSPRAQARSTPMAKWKTNPETTWMPAGSTRISVGHKSPSCFKAEQTRSSPVACSDLNSIGLSSRNSGALTTPPS